MAKRQKVKEFIKEHKLEFIWTGVTIVTAVTIGKFYNSRINKLDYEMNFENLTIADFGNVGEKLCEAYPSIKPDTVVKAWRIAIPKN